MTVPGSHAHHCGRAPADDFGDLCDWHAWSADGQIQAEFVPPQFGSSALGLLCRTVRPVKEEIPFLRQRPEFKVTLSEGLGALRVRSSHPFQYRALNVIALTARSAVHNQIQHHGTSNEFSINRSHETADGVMCPHTPDADRQRERNDRRPWSIPLTEAPCDRPRRC